MWSVMVVGECVQGWFPAHALSGLFGVQRFLGQGEGLQRGLLVGNVTRCSSCSAEAGVQQLDHGRGAGTLCGSQVL